MIYLDNAATTYPKPQSVIGEVSRCMKEYCGNPGRGSHYMSMRAAETLFSTRNKLDKLFNGYGPENCVFTLNTTYALNIALKSAVTNGCHILISDLEHNSVYRQVVKLCDDSDVTFDIFNTFGGDHQKTVNDIKRKIKSNTKILICLLSSNVCAISLPAEKIGKLCKSSNILFIADAAQSAGVYEIDMKKFCIDALCVPSHKALYGPQGAGAVLFSRDFPFSVRSFIEGGSGSNSKEKYMPYDLPDRFEAGTMPTPSIAGLGAGIDFINEIGISVIRRHEGSLAKLLTDELMSDKRYTLYGGYEQNGIVLFNVKGMSSVEVAEELNRRNICVRSGFHCAPLAHNALNTGKDGAVRISFGVFNDLSDVRETIDTLSVI